MTKRLAALLVVVATLFVATTVGANAVTTKKVETATVKVSGTPLPALPATGRDPAVGQTAPTLTGKAFNGKKAVTPSTTGKPQAIVFLAHWCPHCQAEVPVLVELAKAGAFDGVNVSGVATGTSSQRDNYPPSKWLKGQKWPYPVMVDSKDGAAARAYGLTAYPYFVFLDASGKVAGRLTGELSRADLRTVFSALAAGQPLNINRTG